MPSSAFLADMRQRFEIIDHNRNSAPLVSLGQARIAAEAIAKQIYIAELERQENHSALRHKDNIANMMLGTLIQKLHKHQMVPRWVLTTLGTIQHFGNLGSHDVEGSSQTISSDRIIPCLTALSSLSEWFSEVYLDEALQLQIKSMENKQNAFIEQLEQIDHLETTAESLQLTIQSSLQQVRSMQLYAANWLKRSSKEFVHPLREEIEYSKKKNLYHLDNGEDVEGFEMEEIGNLTGLGKPDDKDEGFWNEINMALSLSSPMQIAQELIPKLVWVYYTSKREFIYIAPWRSHRTKCYSDILLELEFFTGGLPERNPNRSLFWTSPYKDAYGAGLMVSLAAPIDNGNEFLGTIAIDLGLDLLCEHLRLHTPSKGFHLLVNDKGEVLGHPYRVSAHDDAIQSMTDLLNISTEHTQELLSLPTEEPYSLIIEEKEHTVYSHPVAQTNWTLFLMTPQG